MPTAMDFLLAWSLLTGTCTEQDYVRGNTPEVREALAEIAVLNEYMDKREQSYYFSEKHFKNDVYLIQLRYAMLKDAPKTSDPIVLPLRTTLLEGIKFNREFLKHLEIQMAWNTDRADIYRVVIIETNNLYQIWSTACDATCDFYYITIRREALLKLKQMVGDDVYYSKEPFPPCVPIWRFRER
jgi:hypothetical protein